MRAALVWILLLLIGFSSYCYWRYKNSRTVKMQYLHTTNTSPPAGNNYLPEQRRKFALEFEKKFKATGKDVNITTTGDFHKTLLMKGNVIDQSFALKMKDNDEAIKEFRDMGFKHLVVTNGRTAWDVDLKN